MLFFFAYVYVQRLTDKADDVVEAVGIEVGREALAGVGGREAHMIVAAEGGQHFR